MRWFEDEILLSPSDLTAFVACRHKTALDHIHLRDPLPQGEIDALDEAVKRLGLEHEQRYLDHLKATRECVVEIDSRGKLRERADRTLAALREGADVVYQGVLLAEPWHGIADFLVRVPGNTELGPFGYEVVDTKLARSAKSRHVLQLCLYTDLLAALQGAPCAAMHLVLGDGRKETLRPTEFGHYVRATQQALRTYLREDPRRSYPQPCSSCEQCRWKHLCTRQWDDDDHLSLVANMRRSQIARLNASGVRTVRELAALEKSIPHVPAATLDRMVSQARLQIQKRDTGRDTYELLPVETGRGFLRLPPPATGDLFLDLEGDPFFPDGLEYLFGLYWAEGARPRFQAFWAHNTESEKQAFAKTVDFILAHLRAHPGAHVYHYGHYEESAFKRLASVHGTHEAAIDEMLRSNVLVNLYQVVREALRISEPRTSIKNLEVFYQDAREEEVKTATDSIVVYERWRLTGDDALLEEIGAYNEQDCRSTASLRDWLLGLRPTELPWFVKVLDLFETEKQRQRIEADVERQKLEARLIEHDPDGVHATVAHLLDFHKREARPGWWAFFDRQNRPDDELMDDAECLGGLTRIQEFEPRPEKRSWLHAYRYPAQETKLKAGAQCHLATAADTNLSVVELDAESRTVLLKTTETQLPARCSLIPSRPVEDNVLRQSIRRVAESLLEAGPSHRALMSLLRRDPPRLVGHEPGQPLTHPHEDLVAATTRAALALDESYLLLQGPPGAGKTHTASHVIVEMIRRGRRVGVSSNSHKAIHNLLAAVERVAAETGVEFRGLKKASRRSLDSAYESPSFTNSFKNGDQDPRAHDLVAGTAWLFARPELEGVLDTLFVDEAGQVSLANLVAMAPCAKNLVLVGDQMQLGQPIQGSHPGGAGVSALEFLLGETPTIPPDRGIFLDVTWRMHPDVCRFISDAVYDGRLQSHPNNARQRLVLGPDADPRLTATGIRFLPVVHSGNAQRSDEEAQVVRELYESLLHQAYVDRDGHPHAVTAEQVLVVAPYNVQVNHLRDVLPEGARVGTVDKFQGREAEVVLISLATSSGEELPRNVEFLYSKNRLNVAISRARCLAMLVASPQLLEIPCSNVEQMRLVNTLCWVRDYGQHL